MYCWLIFDFYYRKSSTSQGVEKSGTGPSNRCDDPLPREQPTPTTPAPEKGSRKEIAVLAEPARETKLPAPIVIGEVPTDEGAGRDKAKDLTVAEPAAKSSSPEPQDPGRVEVPPHMDAADIRDASANVGDMLGGLPQDIPESSVAAASPFVGSLDNFSIDDVPDPTLELFLDPLLHPDKIACMLEFRHRFYEYSKVSRHTICSVIAVDI